MVSTTCLRTLTILCLALASSPVFGQQVGALDPLGGIGNLLGGVTHAMSDLTGGALAGTLGASSPAETSSTAAAARLGGSGGGLGGVLPNVLSSANNMVTGVTRPVMGLLGTLTGAGPQSGGLLGDTLRMTTGALTGLTSGAAAGVGYGGLGGSALSGTSGSTDGPAAAAALHNAHKREAVAQDFMAAEQAGAYEAGAHLAGAQAAHAENSAAAAAATTANMLSGSPNGVGPFATGPFGPASPQQSAVEGLAAPTPLVAPATPSQIVGRAVLANEAMRNAHAESALAGADMVAHGANNARSASLASNAYRTAKLASARDRVNIAGTIQNSARISDAAIATHDAATKAEDSLLGSELAVDSAATVLDSDGAYIPPVSSSLLRSLPYGRLGVRNIIPKPLTYPSVLLPDVWLNGVPVNYLNVPMRMLPYTVGPTAATNPLWASGAALANGQIINGQPFIANNGMLLNGMLVDPALAYLSNVGAQGAGVPALTAGSSILPVLANGQLEAQDEVAAANLITMQQQSGAGMSATYQGYGRLNPVPMITGSVSDNNLLPTSTVGTTYPIGSALVIEPRDSFFQDYVDNASSRQNFDERQQ